MASQRRHHARRVRTPRALASTLLLLPLLLAAAAAHVHGAVDTSTDYDDVVTSLPTVGTMPTETFGGYASVDADTGAELYYLFFASQSDTPTLDDTILWLNGGPGCSSMWGAFNEISPYRINDDMEMAENAYSWNVHYNLLFIDSPVNTGYSYVGEPSGVASSEEQVISQLYDAVQTFFYRHPEYAPSPLVNETASSNDYSQTHTTSLWAAGESWAGIYIPDLLQKIINENAVLAGDGGVGDDDDDSNDDNDASSEYIHLSIGGALMCNAWIDPLLQVDSYCGFLYDNGLIDADTLAEGDSMYDEYAALVAAGDDVAATAKGWSIQEYCTFAADPDNLGVNPYNINATIAGGDPTDAYTQALTAYLNDPATLDALHVSDSDYASKWSYCSAGPLVEMMSEGTRSTSDSIVAMLNQYSDIQFLLFNGNLDVTCNWEGCAAIVDSWGAARENDTTVYQAMDEDEDEDEAIDAGVGVVGGFKVPQRGGGKRVAISVNDDGDVVEPAANDGGRRKRTKPSSEGIEIWKDFYYYSESEVVDWILDDGVTVAGQYQAAGSLCRLVADGAGHQVPFYTPQASQQMVHEFITGTLCDYIEGNAYDG